MNEILPDQFEKLFLNRTQWIDVRAPIEFGEGAIPQAINLPLLMNSERHDVGLTYKTQGQPAAIELGHRLVSGEVREDRLSRWMATVRSQPDSVLYCFRGGLRSQTVQNWLANQGVEVPIISGGYKALRNFLLAALKPVVDSIQFRVVSGPTGSGKTKYLANRPALDLEKLAKHRGSAFGAMSEPQPTQANFENALIVDLLRLKNQTILIEDESPQIGHRLIPSVLFSKMQSSERIFLDVPLETRVENIFEDYVVNSSLGRNQDMQRFIEFRVSVQAISRRLGGVRTQEIVKDLTISEQEFSAGHGLESNRNWIRKLLMWYYDPLYKHALERAIK